MKRLFSIFMVLVMLLSLSACGGSEAPPEQEDQPVQDQPEKEPSEETLPPVMEEEDSVVPLQLMMGTGYLSEWDENYNELCTASWDALVLREEDAKTYPKLADALAELNDDQSVAATAFVQEMLPYAEEALASNPEYFGGFTSNAAYTIQRADNKILSIRVDGDEYTGGVHPNYGVYGVNIDPITGEKMELTDILTDTEAIYPLLEEKLAENYPEETFFGSLDELLQSYQPEDFGWTLGYQGITFYFSPYDIAPYAAGLLTATIWFDEMPSLFREEYITAPEGGYAMALLEWTPMEVDLKAGDGQRDTLSYAAYEGEYGSKELTLTLNGVDYPEETWVAFDMTPYLVCTGERFWLYVEARIENDYRIVYIYDLNGDAPELVSEFSGAGFAGRWDESAGVDGIYYYDVLTNPADFALGSICHLLGTKTAVRDYSVNPEDGTLVPVTEEYRFNEGQVAIVSAVPLDVTILPGNKSETLPAGTEFVCLRTDNESWVDLRLTDGRECRIEIVEVDYTPTINGIPEWDCFVDLMYAG